MKTYIWTIPTRIFHWLLVFSFVTAYVVGGEDEYLNLHTAAGYLLGVLLIFRIIWGFIGPRYSKFSDFPVSIASITSFLKNIRNGKEDYAGHNPAASVVMISMMIVGILLVCSGVILLTAENAGIFNFLGNIPKSEFIEEIHPVLANLLLVLIGIHLLGLITDFIFQKNTGTVFSMITGNKNLKSEDARLNSLHKIFAVIWILASITVFYAGLTMQKLNSVENEQKIENTIEEDNEDDDDDND